MDNKTHWESIYSEKKPNQVSWYREHLDNSLKMIVETKIGKQQSIIDVGGGNSTLVDDLLDFGFSDVAVLDISGKALAESQVRLEHRSEHVEWIEADVTKVSLPENRFDLWHDRAVFHFLTDLEDRRKYVELVMKSLKPRGHIIVASFGLDGPEKCSGLDIVRYSPDSMHDEFGTAFDFVKSVKETHETPFATTQEFIYCYCRKLASGKM